jgi:hypothetical protein
MFNPKIKLEHFHLIVEPNVTKRKDNILITLYDKNIFELLEERFVKI